MIQLLKTKVGRLRILGFLGGVTLLLLIIIAVPMKHLFDDPFLVRVLGPIHGGLFLLYVINTLGVATEQNWSFRTRTWKVIVACLIPFGTFYIDNRILRRIDQ